MTAHAIKGYREECIKAGMNDYITKPVSPADISAAVQRWALTPSRPADAPVADATESAPLPPAGPAMTLPTTIDRGIFDAEDLLHRVMDDAELMQAVLAAFLEDIPKQQTSLRTSLQAGDIAVARRHAHTIKGAAGNVSASALRETARAMEKLAEQGNLAGVEQLLIELDRRVEEITNVLRSELERATTKGELV